MQCFVFPGKEMIEEREQSIQKSYDVLLKLSKERLEILQNSLKLFDFYKDLPRGLAQPTLFGATMSTGFLVLLGALIFYQVTEFMAYQKSSEMLIDSAQADQFVSANTPKCLTCQISSCSTLSTSTSPCRKPRAPSSVSTWLT